MKTRLPLLLGALLTIAPALPAAADHHGDHPKDIVDTAVAAGSFRTLVAAVQAAGLEDALRSKGPFTVFAPTDGAFAALPDGTVEGLLRPESREQLQRILKFHVVPGRVLSTDLLPTPGAATLAGDAVSFGLRVGSATVTSPDIACSNGVIHVIDTVLLPPAKNARPPGHDETSGAIDVEQTLATAIERGVPVFNAGDAAGCARIYREAARAVLVSPSADLAELHRADLEAVLHRRPADAAEEAWALREVFDRMFMDREFRPQAEAVMPQGFPGPGKVGHVVMKEYPRYRAARAEGRAAFWQLFEHIKKNEVEMTSPVEMTMDDGMRMRDMAFLYEHGKQGAPGTQGAVAVLDLEPVSVLSIGMRGRRSEQLVMRAKHLLQSALNKRGITAAGDWRVLGYNSPMVPAEQQYWELQVPIAAAQ